MLVIRLHRTPEPDVDPGGGQFVRERPGHFRVEGRQDVFAALDHGHGQAAFAQILRRLQPDEPGADHDGALRTEQTLHRAVHVAEGPKVRHVRIIVFGEHLARRSRADRQKKFIIRFGIFAVRTPDGQRFGRAVDLHRLVPCADVHAEPRREFLRRHDEQVVAFRDDAAQMVRQTAVRVGDECALFEQDDPGGFVQTAQTRRRAGSGGHAAHNDDFHSSPSSGRRWFRIKAINTAARSCAGGRSGVRSPSWRPRL